MCREVVMCRYILERAKHSWMKIVVVYHYILARMLTLVPRYRFANAPTVKVRVRVKVRVTVTSAVGNNDYSVYVIGHDYESIQFN